MNIRDVVSKCDAGELLSSLKKNLCAGDVSEDHVEDEFLKIMVAAAAKKRKKPFGVIQSIFAKSVFVNFYISVGKDGDYKNSLLRKSGIPYETISRLPIRVSLDPESDADSILNIADLPQDAASDLAVSILEDMIS